MLPHELLIASLKALRDAFPLLPVSIFTESLGGSEQRLRDDVAQFAIYPLTTPGAGDDLEADFLAPIEVVPVISVDHPLAREPEPVTREALEPHVQLVLTDRTPLTQHPWAEWSATTSGVSPTCRPGSNSSWRASAGATCRCTWYARPSRRAG